MKNTILSVAIGIALLGCLLAVFANVSSSKLNKMLDEERYKRISAEQMLEKLQQNLKTAEAELGRATSKMMSIEKILTDGRVAEEELKEELEAAKQEKDKLIQQLENIQQILPAGAEQTVDQAPDQPVEPAVEQ